MYFPPKVDHKVAALEPPSIPEPRTSTFEATLKHNAATALDWRTDFKYNEKTRIGRLALEATNNAKDKKAIPFGSICVSLEHTPNEGLREDKLFSEQGWRLDHDNIMADIYKTGHAKVTVFTKRKVQEEVPSLDELQSGGKGQTKSDAALGDTDDVPTTDEPSSEETKFAAGGDVEQSGEAENSTSQSNKSAAPPTRVDRWVEKVIEEVQEQRGNVYDFEHTWKIDEDLPDKISGATSELWVKSSTSMSTRALEFTLLPGENPESEGPVKGEEDDASDVPTGFMIPYKKGFKLEIQGEIAELGQYAVQIYETRKKIERDALKGGGYAIDWKMVELKKGADEQIEVSCWDVSDRLEEEAKAKAEAEAAAAAAAE